MRNESRQFSAGNAGRGELLLLREKGERLLLLDKPKLQIPL
jgi:hypothetical protein